MSVVPTVRDTDSGAGYDDTDGRCPDITGMASALDRDVLQQGRNLMPSKGASCIKVE